MSRLVALLALSDFEIWRPRMTGLLILASISLVTYWILWFYDRSLVAAEQTSVYIDFEQSFPLADAGLAGAALLAAIQLWRRRQNTVLWLMAVGGASTYLCAMDVLYDLQHGIYTRSAASTELVINTATGALGIGVISFAWRFRRLLEGKGLALRSS